MDYFEELQCFFCTKNAEQSELIEMSSNAIQIGDDVIDFGVLIRETFEFCLDIKNDNSLICDECKNLLVQFYMLKINAKKNNNNNAHKQQKEILLEVKTYLSKFHPQQELIVSRYNNCLTIAPDLQKTLLTPEPTLETIEDILEEPSEMTATDEYGNEIVFKEEADYSVIDEIISETEEVYEYLDKNENDTEEVSEFKTVVKMENQVDEPWLIDEMKNSKLTLNTKFGKQVIYKCFQCSKVMQSSEEMRTHLLDHMDNKIQVQEIVNDDYGEEIVEETVVPMLPKVYKTSQPKSNSVLKPSNNTWMNDEIKKNRGIVKTESGPKYIYKCLECNYNCSGENTFRKHLQKFHQTSVHDLKAHYHSASDVNCCLDCGLKFKNAAAYKTHANCHFLFDTISSQSSLLTCQDCRVVFFKDVDLSTHYRRHGTDHMYDKLPSIGVLYKQGKLYMKPIHAEIDVPDDEAFNCGYCTRKFETAHSCFAHQMVVHATSYICPLCQRDFDGPRSAKHYTQHLQNKHSELFPSIMFSCTYCAEAFTTIFDKLSHMKICNERKFISDSDGKKFFTKADLIKHVKFISGECVFKCPSCNKKCRSPSDLQIHVRSHTLERPYPCSQCSKAFRTLSARSSHMETHTGFEIECEYCKMVFKKRCVYLSHVKFQHDESYRMERFSSFTCKLCKGGKSYLRRLQYKTHMRSVHHINIDVEEQIEFQS